MRGNGERSEQVDREAGSASADWRRDPFALVGAYRNVLLAGGVDPAKLTDPQLVAGLREFLRLVAPNPFAVRRDPLAGPRPWRSSLPAMRWVTRSR